MQKLFNLETGEESRINRRIFLSTVLSSFLLWCMWVSLNRIFIDKNFPTGLLQINDPHEILALIVSLMAGVSAGLIICQFTKSHLRTEEELKKSKESYQLIFEQAADGIFIIDKRGNFIDVNESGCKLTGYTYEEFLHLKLNDVLIEEEEEIIHSRMNQINGTEILGFEEKVRHKNGSLIYVEVRARRLADGRLQGLVRDISQSKQIEEALRANNELFAQFMQHSPIYAYFKEVTPTQSVVLHASENYQEMIGIPGSQMIGKNMYELFPAEFAGKMTADDWAVVSNGVVLKLDEELNGHSYTTIKFPIQYSDKTYLAGYTIDITSQKNVAEQIRANQVELQRLLDETELSRRALLSLVEDQKEAEEQIRKLNTQLEQRVNERTAQLAAANKELEAFAYSVSHDLRAPLRALDGFSAALLDDYAGQLDEQGRHYLSRIQEASQHMGQLINSLLNLSKVTRVELKYQQVDLSELARSITSELTALAPDRQVNFEIAANMLVTGDANLLKIALENLLNNAYKFTGKCAHATIQVGVTEQAGERVFFVKDNGTGFNMDYASKLFTPFQRLHNDKEFPGTGIGLSIVHRIITRHGGRIWPESSVGQGTTFYFTLKSS